ncbi:hypothetical protein T484DRAFT_1756042 [Baffinella frigidus]|nr:hypothetical protein T484DRAFT_1756042 [Cryptophyta sp. CCMP2293]
MDSSTTDRQYTPYEVNQSQKVYFYGLDPRNLDGVLIDNDVVAFDEDGGHQLPWRITQDVLEITKIREKFLTELTPTTHAAGMWVAEKVLSENTTQTRYPEWTIGRIQQISWAGNMVPKLVIQYPGYQGRKVPLYPSGNTVELENDDKSGVVSADEDGWFTASSDHNSGIENLGEPAQLVIFSSELLRYHDESGLATRENEVHKKQVSVKIQSADVTQRTEAIHRRDAAITSREKELTDAQDRLQRDVEEFEHHRSQSAATNNDSSVELEKKLVAALEATKQAETRLHVLRQTLQETDESTSITANEHVAELTRRLEQAEAGETESEKRAQELQTQFELSCKTLEAANKRREDELESQIAHAEHDQVKYAAMATEIQNKAEGSDDEEGRSSHERIESLEAQLQEALEQMKEYQHRVTALHEERIQHKQHTDHLISQHEEFVERSNERSVELIKALEESEAKYRNINVTGADEEAARESTFRVTSDHPTLDTTGSGGAVEDAKMSDFVLGQRYLQSMINESLPADMQTVGGGLRDDIVHEVMMSLGKTNDTVM